MQTIDIHTHLLNPRVRFDRLFDRIALGLFGKNMGLVPDAARKDPYAAYVRGLTGSVRESRLVKKICLLPVDSRLDNRGIEIHRDATVCSCTDDVLAVFGSQPEVVIPFLSVNPLRTNALDLLDEYIEKGCRGAKFLQNYWGIDLNDRRFIPYYEKLRERSIPLVVHIGGEYTIESTAQYEGAEMLRTPLETGVTVIAAHLGLGRIRHRAFAWRNLSRNPEHFDADYFTLLSMLEHHSNLYADLAAILSPMRARALRHISNQHQVHGKILFGTDYPVPFTTRFNTCDLPAVTRKSLGRIPNPFDRYAAVLLEYFPEDSPIYTNYGKIGLA
jgi:uncharacterized protein